MPSAAEVPVLVGPAVTAMSAAVLAMIRPSTLALACLLAPVDGQVLDPFRPPPCPWCPGNRGLEMAVEPGEPVRAMGDGRVVVAGEVAGVAYVSVEHPSGLRTTVGRLSRVSVREGQQVVPGQVLGAAGESLIVTVRRDGSYLDPAPLIGRPTWRPRLVPLDGTPARPARSGPVRCGVGGAGVPG